MSLQGACREPAGRRTWLVTMTSPNLANAVCTVARRCCSSTERHWKAVLQIIEYLLSGKNLSAAFERRSGWQMLM